MVVTAVDVLYLLQEEEVDADVFKMLNTEKKFKLLTALVHRGVIKSQTEFNDALKALDWKLSNFLDALEDLWTKKKIGWEEIDVLDTHSKVFKGPGLLSDRIIGTRIDRDSLCKRIPPKYHDDYPPCQGYGK